MTRQTIDEMQKENQALRSRLEAAEEMLRAIPGGKNHFSIHGIFVHVQVVVAQHRERDLDEELLSGVIRSIAAEMDRKDVAIDSILAGRLRRDGGSTNRIAIPLQDGRASGTERALSRIRGERSDSSSEHADHHKKSFHRDLSFHQQFEHQFCFPGETPHGVRV